MRLIVIASAAAVLMSASAGSALADSQPGMASATQVSVPAEPLKDPVVCRNEAMMNSRVQTVIVCAKQSEWDRRTREDRERLERIEGVNLNPG